MLLLSLALPLELEAQRSHSSRTSSSHSSTRSSSPRNGASKSHSGKTVRKSTVAVRDSHGRIKRSASARNAFKKQTGYPHGRKGYVVDHIVPLECGGPDVPSNMQWQTVAEAKVKDRTERNCRRE